MAAIPKYRRQRRSTGKDSAFVEIDGHRTYLGKYATPESREAYRRTIAEIDAGGLTPPPSTEITVSELVARFWVHAEQYYRLPDGAPTSEVSNFRSALRPLIAIYSTIPVSKFGPNCLRTVRANMIKLGWCRSNINKCISRLKHVFRWGTEHEIVAASVYHALLAVRGLAPGRSNARESEPKRPVPYAHIEAVRQHVSRQVWALIQLQLFTGARGGELLNLRAIDIDTTGKVWTYQPSHHKTRHHGLGRTILFGPRCQCVLSPFMADRPVGASLFSARQAEIERHSNAPTHRRPGQQPNYRKTERTVGECYTPDS